VRGAALRTRGITRYALLTLTYRDTGVLAGSVSRCWAALRKLRQRKLWGEWLQELFLDE